MVQNNVLQKTLDTDNLIYIEGNKLQLLDEENVEDIDQEVLNMM